MPHSVTKTKKLRSGTPIWSAYAAPVLSFSKLKKDQTTDIVIIGAGISGAMLAEELTDAGFSVVVLDKREPLKGSTAATTALLLYEIDNPVTKLQKQIGLDHATQVWRRSKLALEGISEKVRKLGISCDLKGRSSLYLSGDDLDDDGIQKECELRNQLGFTTKFFNKRDLASHYNIKRRSALQSYSALEANPVQLAAGLFRRAIERGAKIYSPVEVSDVESGARQVRVYTKEGPVIRAKHVIFATGYEIPEYIKTRKHKINSTWVFATKPQKILWPERAFIWEASSPYLYMRTTVDRRVICGGEDEDFSSDEKRESLTEEKIAILQTKLSHIFPHLDVTADFVWSGAFGSSTTGLPTIGEIPGLPNCFSVMGYGGNGITFSKIASELLRARLSGTEDPDQPLFDFKKK